MKSLPQFVEDVKDSVRILREDPSLNKSETTALYGLTASIPDPNLVKEFLGMGVDGMLAMVWMMFTEI